MWPLELRSCENVCYTEQDNRAIELQGRNTAGMEVAKYCQTLFAKTIFMLLFACLFVCLFVCLFRCLFVWLVGCLFVCLFCCLAGR